MFLAFAEGSAIELIPNGTMFIHIALILIMIWILNRTFFRPISKILGERDKNKGGKSGEAQSILQQVDGKLAKYDSAMRDANYFAHSRDFGEGTVGGYAYLFIGAWKEPVSEEALDLALARMRDAPGLIIDVRNNAGGTDRTALAFASRFTTRAFTASYVEIRMDSLVRNIEMPLARTVRPRGAWQFTRPVVVLSGRGGFSATESFVAAMRTLPQVTVVGDTTGGASGNPATFSLGNGWRFTVPRWLEFGPDKRPIEGRGVAPHLAVTWDPASYDSARDPLIDAAVGLLGERNGVYRIAPASSQKARVETATRRGLRH